MGKHKVSPDDSCQFCPFCLQRLIDTNLTLVQHSSFEFNVKTSTADTVSSVGLKTHMIIDSTRLPAV